MSKFWTFVMIVTVWILSFVEPSGWSLLLHLPEKVNWGILLLTVMLYMLHPSQRISMSKPLAFFLIISFILIPYFMWGSWQGASYLTAFMVVYVISQGTITDNIIRLSGIAIAGLGLVVLFIYATGSLLSGWNDNAMSMTGLFSFLYFSIYLILIKGKRKFWFWNIVTILYLQLLFSTDCRSGMLFSMIAVAGIIYSRLTKRLLRNSSLVLLMFNLPLIIAFSVISISQIPVFYDLNQWSLEKFGKQIFSGRDELWDYSLQLLAQTSYLGTGKFLINYHNSGIAALTVFGLLGYYCWIKYFNRNFKILRRYLDDKIVLGSAIAFAVLFLQQSVDLGFISPNPNLIPYMILGVGLGRVRLISKD